MSTTVTAGEVEQRIRDILDSFSDRDLRSIGRDTRFEDLAIDSLDIVELAQIIDEEYGVEITDEDAARLNTLGEAVDLIVARAPSVA